MLGGERENSIVTETVCRNYSFPSLFMFSSHCTPSFVLSFSPSHSFPLAHSSPFCISLTPPCTTSPLPLKTGLSLSLPPPLYHLFTPSFLFLPLLPPPPSLFPSVPDIVALCPMSHTSVKTIRGKRERESERQRQEEKKQESMTEREREPPGREEGRECISLFASSVPCVHVSNI